VSFKFNLPDGTTEQFSSQASRRKSAADGEFFHRRDAGPDSHQSETALTSAIGTLANTSLVAASAVAAGNDFFNSVGTVRRKRGQQQGRRAITGATLFPVPQARIRCPPICGGRHYHGHGQTLTFEAAAR